MDPSQQFLFTFEEARLLVRVLWETTTEQDKLLRKRPSRKHKKSMLDSFLAEGLIPLFVSSFYLHSKASNVVFRINPGSKAPTTPSHKVTQVRPISLLQYQSLQIVARGFPDPIQDSKIKKKQRNWTRRSPN